MTVILCLDDKNGMMFNRRRQSRDRAMLLDMMQSLQEAGACALRIRPYSEKLLQEAEGESGTALTDLCPIQVCDDPFADADTDAADAANTFCFIEDTAIEPHLEQVDALWIYRWNRHYPADLHFTADPAAAGFRCVHTADFPGFSHEKITKEVYRR